MITTTKPCAGEGCFECVEVPIIEALGRTLEFKLLCESCEQKYKEEAEQKASLERRIRLKTAFDAICPPLYRDTDLKRIYGAFSAIAESWQYSPTGLLLEGYAGTGKTRAAWHILKRMTEEGRSCYGLTATQFAKAAADQWHSNNEEKGEAIEAMDRCRRTSILLIDDLGKQKMTERSEVELYDVLEHRTNNLKPTIVTTNATGAQLTKMLSEDRAHPILRRIRDFSILVKYER
jgi:DNA replication protein DnaC